MAKKKKKAQGKNDFDNENFSDDTDLSSKKGNQAHSLCKKICKECRILANIKEGCLYIYEAKKGYYVRRDKSDFPYWLYNTLVGTEYEKILNNHLVREVYSRLLATTKQVSMEDFDNNERYINVINGVADLKTEKLLPHDSKFKFLNVIHGKYKPKKKEKSKKKEDPKNFMKMLDHIFNDEDDQKLFLETFAYLISNICSAKVCFFYLGAPHTGKSVLLRLLTELIGRDFVSTLPIEKFSERFAITTLYGKKVNICGEHEGARTLNRTSVLKGLIGGDWLDAEPKGKPHFKFKAKTKCVFASNSLLEVNPKIIEDALVERFIFVGFDNPIDKEKRVADFDQILLEERDAIVTLLINTLIKWRGNGCKFTQTKQSKKLLKQFKNQKGSVDEFVVDCCDLVDDDYTLCAKLCQNYAEYCEINCMEKLSNVCFIKDLIKLYPSLKKKKIHKTGQNALWGVKGIKLKSKK